MSSIAPACYKFILNTTAPIGRLAKASCFFLHTILEVYHRGSEARMGSWPARGPERCLALIAAPSSAPRSLLRASEPGLLTFSAFHQSLFGHLLSLSGSVSPCRSGNKIDVFICTVLVVSGRIPSISAAFSTLYGFHSLGRSASERFRFRFIKRQPSLPCAILS